MDIRLLSAKDFANVFAAPQHIYNTVDFCQLNSHKVRAVQYLLLEEGKTKLGIILGRRDEGLFSPFSAPFGGFVANKTPSLKHIDQAVTALKTYARNNLTIIRVSLPPLIYAPSLTNKTVHSMLRQGCLHHVDINHHFCLDNFDNYENCLKLNAKQKLRTALNAGFTFQHIDSGDTDGVRRAYEVIRLNRQQHGYPLRMSLDDVLATIKIVPADFFVMSLNGTDVAAAQVYEASSGIAQVIYWGDREGFSELRPMNALAYHLFDFYHKRGTRIVDIGPSSENGQPSYGLADYKESVGCTAGLKFTFTL